MADDIFGNPGTVVPAQDTQVTPATTEQPVTKPAESPQPITDPYANLLSGIQAEDGRQKYATVSDAINSIPHAQTHIKELSDKVKDLEGKLDQSTSIEDVLKRVEQSKQAVDETPSKQELDETTLAQQMEAFLNKREHNNVQKTNQEQVVSSLAEKFGDKAKETYVAKATELGLSIEVFNDLARRSPKAVLQYFDASPKQSVSSFTKPSVNTAALDMTPKVEIDPMAKFRSHDTELLQKWRTAASKIEG